MLPRELLVLDQVPIINEARNEFEAAYDDITGLKAELHRHESCDLPAYSRWLNRLFGVLLSEIRELSDLLGRKTAELAVVRKRHWARFFEDGPYHHFESGMGRAESVSGLAAAAAVAAGHAGAHASWRSGWQDSDEETGWGPARQQHRYEEAGLFHDDEDESHFDENLEAARQFERHFRRREQSGFEGFERTRGSRTRKEAQRCRDTSANNVLGEPSDAHDRPLTQEELREIRIKDVYRALARRLHPDANPDLGSEELQLWHQAQAAYQKRNLEQLEVLLALANVVSGKLLRSSSLYEIKQATLEVRRLLAPLRRKIDEAKKHKAWKFLDLSDRAALARVIERDLHKERQELRGRLAELEKRLRRFSAL